MQLVLLNQYRYPPAIPGSQRQKAGEDLPLGQVDWPGLTPARFDFRAPPLPGLSIDNDGRAVPLSEQLPRRLCEVGQIDFCVSSGWLACVHLQYVPHRRLMVTAFKDHDPDCDDVTSGCST